MFDLTHLYNRAIEKTPELHPRLKELRDKAWIEYNKNTAKNLATLLKKTKLPNLSSEEFNQHHYIDRSKWAEFSQHEDDELLLVFYQGKLLYQSAELLGNNRILGITSKKIEDQDALAISQVLTTKHEANSLSVLSLALMSAGYFFHITEPLQKKIRVVHLVENKNEARQSVFVQNVILLEDGISCHLSEVILDLSTQELLPNHLSSIVSNVVLGENARLVVSKAHILSHQAECFSQNFFHLQKYAHVDIQFYTTGARSAFSLFDVDIEGKEAHASIEAVIKTKNNSSAELQTYMRHIAPHGQSNQLIKAVAEDKSQAVFDGLVFIGEAGEKTHATQLNKNLILDDSAQIVSNPNLIINTDDVKCSHGSATGQIRFEELFYLQSRGIDREEARKILTKGFIDEVLLRFTDKKIRGFIEERL